MAGNYKLRVTPVKPVDRTLGFYVEKFDWEKAA